MKCGLSKELAYKVNSQEEYKQFLGFIESKGFPIFTSLVYIKSWECIQWVGNDFRLDSNGSIKYPIVDCKDVIGFKDDVFVLPEKWCVCPKTEENLQIIKDCVYFGDRFEYYDITFEDNTYTSDKDYETHLQNALEKGYKEITFDQFKQYVLKDNVQTVEKENISEPSLKFEIGKWYEFNFVSKYYLKCSKVDSTYFYYDEGYSFDLKKFKDYKGQSHTINIKPVVEISIEEIQKYLPEGHSDKIVKNEFKKGDYIVTLKIQYDRTYLYCGRNNYCFKQRVDNKSNYPEVDLKGNTTNGHDILSFDKKGWLKDWRYATPEEIDMYNFSNKPFDVTTLNTKPKSLVGRYLKALVDYPWSIGDCKKGDYLIIVDSTQCYKVKDKGKNKWIYANSYSNYLPHQDFELMPEGFIPESKVKSEIPEYVICISEVYGLTVGKVYPVIGESVIDGTYNNYPWDCDSFMPSTKDYYDLQNSSAKISSNESKPLFQVGDKVKAIAESEGWGDVNYGDIGIVKFVYDNKLSVDFPNHDNWHGTFNCFELVKHEAHKVSNEPVINTYGLYIGDFLPNAVIKEWASKGNNWCGNDKVWIKGTGSYIGDRKIEGFKVIDGIVGFKVSGSSTYLKAEGFKQFRENFNKSERTVTFEELVKQAEIKFPVGSKVKLLAGKDGSSEEYTIPKEFYEEALTYYNKNVVSKAGCSGYLYYEGKWAELLEISTETSKTDIMTEDKFDSLFKESEEEFKVGDWVIVNTGTSNDSIILDGQCKQIIRVSDKYIEVGGGSGGLWKKTNNFGKKQEFRKATPEEIAKATGKSVIPESYLQYPVKPSEAYKEKVAPVDVLNKYQQTPVIYSGKKVKSKIVTIFN